MAAENEEGVTIIVRGVPEFIVGCEQLGINVKEAVDVAFRRIADQAAILVKPKVPVVTGRLQRSVAANVDDQGGRPNVTMGGDLPYAGWVEYGGTRGRPYLPEGRYVYPTAHAARFKLQLAGELATEEQIRTMSWPTPTKTL
jgi:hypothetical protein